MTKSSSGKRELEGLFTPDGEIAQPLVPIVLRVPLSVSLAGRDGEEPDELWWTLPSHEVITQRATPERGGSGTGKRLARVPPEDLLDRFCELADESGERIERFAEQWGPLGLCKHGVPHTHRPFRTPW